MYFDKVGKEETKYLLTPFNYYNNLRSRFISINVCEVNRFISCNIAEAIYSDHNYCKNLKENTELG